MYFQYYITIKSNKGNIYIIILQFIYEMYAIIIKIRNIL